MSRNPLGIGLGMEADMETGLTIKPVVSVHVAAPVRFDPAPAQQAVTTELPAQKSVTAPSAPAPTKAQERRAAEPRANARDIVIDAETKQVIYRVINVRSGQVVRQVPEESALRLQAYVRALTEGDDARTPHQADLEA